MDRCCFTCILHLSLPRVFQLLSVTSQRILCATIYILHTENLNLYLVDPLFREHLFFFFNSVASIYTRNICTRVTVLLTLVPASISTTNLLTSFSAFASETLCSFLYIFLLL